MRETLVDIYQRRMDRSQSEQLWALAVYAAVNAFVMTEARKFTASFNHCSLVLTLAILGMLTLAFVFERLFGYYIYRNQIAEYLKDEPSADAEIKKHKGVCNLNSLIWAIVFVLAVVVPFVASITITAAENAS